MLNHLRKFFHQNSQSKQINIKSSSKVTKPTTTEVVEKCLIFLEEGNKFWETGDMDSAIAAYRKGLEENPNSVDLHRQLAIALQKKGNFSEAVTHYRQAITLNNSGFVGETEFSNALDLPDFSTNTKHYERLTLNCTSNKSSISFRLTRTKSRQFSQFSSLGNNYQTSLENIETSVTFQGINIDEFRGNFDLKSRGFSDQVSFYSEPKTITDDKLNIAKIYLKQAMVFRDRGSWHQAIEACKQAITIAPHWSEIYHLWSNILRQMTHILESQNHNLLQSEHNYSENRLESAIARYDYQAKLNPDSAIVQTNLGDLYSKNQQWQEAISCYKKAMSIDKNYTLAQQHLNQILSDKQKLTASESGNLSDNNIEDSYPNSEEYLKYKQLEKNTDNYQTALDLESNHWQVYYHLGNLLAQDKQWEKALESYQKVMEIKKDFSWAYNNAGNVCLELHRWEEAKVYFKLAIKLNSQCSWSYYYLGEATSQLEQWEEALTAYQQAQQLQPTIKELNDRITSVKTVIENKKLTLIESS